MVGRALALVTLLGAAPASAVAQGFEYAPGTTRYRITQVSKVSQEMMGQKNDGEATASQLLTVTITRPARDTIAATLVLDSISLSNTAGAPVPPLDRLRGITVQARLSPSGHVVHSVSGPSDAEIPGASEITTAMGNFLPKIRARLAKGASWADTLTGKVKQFGLDVDRRVITRYVVLGDTIVGGEPAWRIARTDSAAISGSGVAQGGALTMEGSSAGKSEFYLTTKGALVGGQGTEDSSVRIVVSSNGMEIGVTTTSTTKVQRVK